MMAAPLIVRATAKHTATVIFVHGLGDTGHGWKPIADMFRKDAGLQHVKWILPHAPVKPVTANMGMSMPTWFDIYSFGFECDEDKVGMLETRSTLEAIIKAEMEEGMSSERIVLGGFSQGGSMTLLTGLTIEAKLAGLAVLSGWLPLRTTIKTMLNAYASEIPIFWGHGKDDPLVTYSKMGKASADLLVNELGIKPTEPGQTNASKPAGLEFHGYDGLVHSASEEELDDLRGWLKRVVPKED